MDIRPDDRVSKSELKPAGTRRGLGLLLWAIGFGLIGFISARIFFPQNNSDIKTPPPKGVFDEIVFNELKTATIPCPDLQLITISGQKHLLSDLRGNVIVLRFTRFHPQDLPSLRYLDSLVERFSKDGLKMFIINELEKTDHRTSFDSLSWNAGLVEDDGSIASLLHAQLNDVVIINRRFEISIRHNQLTDRTTYHLLRQELFGTSFETEKILPKDHEKYIRNLTYINVRNNQTGQIKDIMGKRAVALTLFIFPCLSCYMQYRVSLNQTLLMEASRDGLEIIFLLHPNSPIKEVREWVDKYVPDEKITVGVIEKNDITTTMNYSLVFKYYIDPFMVLFDKNGHLVFSEEPQDQTKLNGTYLESLLK